MKGQIEQWWFGGSWGAGLLVFPRNGSLFAHYIFGGRRWRKGAIPCNQGLSECLSQCVTPRCQRAAGRRWVVTTFDLTASRKLHFYQLLVARSKNLLFISGVIFSPSLLFPFPWYVVSPNAMWICKRKPEFLSPELVRSEDLDVKGPSNLFNISSLSFRVCILILISQLITRSTQTQYWLCHTVVTSFHLVGFILADGADTSMALINKIKQKNVVTHLLTLFCWNNCYFWWPLLTLFIIFLSW